MSTPMQQPAQQLDMKGLVAAVGKEEAAATVRAMMPDDLRDFADAMRDTFGARMTYLRVEGVEVGARTEVDPACVWNPGADFEQRMKDRNPDRTAKTRAQQRVKTTRYK